jgi:hypothetical protein
MSGKRAPDELVLTPPDPGPSRGDPVGRTKGFVERVREVYGAGFANAWLSRVTCDFTHDQIRTTPLGAAMLRKRCSLIAGKHKITIVADPALEARMVVRNADRKRG